MGLAKECEFSLSKNDCSAVALRRAFWLSRPVLQDQDGKLPQAQPGQAMAKQRFSNSVHDSWPYRWPSSGSPCPIELIEPFSPGIGGPSETLLPSFVRRTHGSKFLGGACREVCIFRWSIDLHCTCLDFTPLRSAWLKSLCRFALAPV